jgi:glutathione S-transferase
MPTRQLYGNSFSSNSRRVQVVLTHLNLPIDFIKVDFADTVARAKLTAINPNNKIPVLVEADLVLWESNAINTYLCETTPGQKLLPTEPRKRVEVERWLFWSSAHFSQACGGLNFERMIKKMSGLGDPNPQMVADHERLFHQFAKVVDAHLANREWLANDALSLADISLAAMLLHQGRASYPIAEYRNLLAHDARVQDLPAWRAVEKAA